MKYKVSVYPLGCKFQFQKMPIPSKDNYDKFSQGEIKFNVTHWLILNWNGTYNDESPSVSLSSAHKRLVDLIDVDILSEDLLIYEIDELQIALLMLMES